MDPTHGFEEDAQPPIPPEMHAYVEALSMGGRKSQAAVLLLTGSGIELGLALDGSRRLARLVVGHPDWKGTRSENNVAQEIWAHCLAWRWLPPVRSRANPVDLEFYRAWPLNAFDSLMFSLRSLLRRDGS